MTASPFSRRKIVAVLAGLTTMLSTRNAGAKPASESDRPERRGAAPTSFTADSVDAVPRAIEAKLADTVSVKDFGARGDDKADDTFAFSMAIRHCQARNATLLIPAGIYRITDTLTIGTSTGGPITIVGDRETPMQQGSNGPSAILRWYGGSAPVFALSVSGCAIVGLAIQNFGQATDAFDVVGGQHYYFKRLSFLPLERSKRFRRSIFHMVDASFGYGRWETMWFASAAPRFLFIDGGKGGGTPFEIYGRSIFESNATFGPCTVVHIRDMDADAIHIHDNTFNQQENTALRILDTTDSPRKPVLTGLIFDSNELDIVSATPADRPFTLHNCLNIRFDGNTVQGGSVGAIARLTDCTVTSFDSNYCRSAGHPGLGFFELHGASRVFAGVNQFELTTMAAGIFNDDAAVSGIDPIVLIGVNAFIDLSHSSPTGNGTYRLTLARNVPANLVVSSMTDSRRGMPTRGQEFTLQIVNRSNAALTSLSAQPNFKLAAQALTGIAPGTVRSMRMLFDGKHVQQITPALDISA